MAIRSMIKVEWFSNTKKIFNWFFQKKNWQSSWANHFKNSKKIAKMIKNASLVI